MDLIVTLFLALLGIATIALVLLGLISAAILIRLFFYKPEITEEDMFDDLWKHD